MKRIVLAAVAGFFAWWVVVTIFDHLLRVAWPAYAVAFPTRSFTMAMLAARQVEGAVGTVAAGAIAVRVARARAAGLAMGALLLAFFIPTHILIWSTFPLWYHLLFLGSLLPLSMLGSRLAPSPPTRS